MTQPLLVALVGCGRIAQRHLDALSMLPHRARLIAAVDPDLNAARATLAPHTFTSLDALLNTSRRDLLPRPDLIIIATPSGLHAQLAHTALLANCHVLCEKPLALSLHDAQHLIHTAAQNRRHLLVVQPLRLWPVLTRAKTLLDLGLLGAIHAASAQILWSRPQRYFNEAPWRADPTLDGGVLWNQAYHYLDALTWLLGPLDVLASSQQTRARDIRVPDTASALLRSQHGAHVTLLATLLAAPHNIEASITLCGDRGTIILRGDAAQHLQCWPPNLIEDLVIIEQQTSDLRDQGHLPTWIGALDALESSNPPIEAIRADASLTTLHLLEQLR